MLVDLPHGRTIVPRQSLHILNNLLHKCGGLALFQLFPDSGGVNVGKVLQLRLRKKAVLPHQTGKMPLNLRPGQIRAAASRMNRISGEIVPILAPKPRRRLLLTGMVHHVLLDPALAGNIPVPLLKGGVNVCLGNCGGRDNCKGSRGFRPLTGGGRGFLQFLRREIRPFLEKQSQTLFYFRPGDRSFLSRGVPPEHKSFGKAEVHKAGCAVREGVAACSVTVFLFQQLYGVIMGNSFLILLVNA